MISRQERFNFLTQFEKPIPANRTAEYIYGQNGKNVKKFDQPSGKMHKPIRNDVDPDHLFTERVPYSNVRSRLATFNHVRNKGRIHSNVPVRKNFLAPSVLPRAAGVQIDENYGASVDDVSTDAHTKILTDNIIVDVPDMGDVKWLNAKAALVAAGDEDTLPLGREQRTMKKETKLIDEIKKGALTSEDISHKLVAVREAITRGLTNTTAGQKAAIDELGKIMLADRSGKHVSKKNRNIAAKEAKDLKMGSWKEVGIPHRFWSKQELIDPTKSDQFKTITIYLQNKTKLKNGKIKKFGLDTASGNLMDKKSHGRVTDVIKGLSGKELSGKDDSKSVPAFPQLSFIDLDNVGSVPLMYALNAVRGGVDGQMLNGFKIPPGSMVSPDIIPVGVLNPAWAKKKTMSFKDQQNKGVDIDKLSVGKLETIALFSVLGSTTNPFIVKKLEGESTVVLPPKSIDAESEKDAAARFMRSRPIMDLF